MNDRKNIGSNAVEMLAYARGLIRQRKVVDGLEAYRALNDRYPDYAEGWFQRSGTEQGSGNALTAIAAGKKAVELAPGNALFRTHLAQLQVAYGFWGDALATLSALLEKPPSSFEAKIANAIGAVQSLAGLEVPAQPWFEGAAKAAPEQASYAFNVAQGLTHCGLISKSEEAFERLLGRFPDYARGHWARATLNPRHDNDQQLSRVRAALTRAASPGDEVYYCFALFALLDAADRTAESFAELEHGMKLQRAIMRYNGEDITLLQQLARLGESLPVLDQDWSHEQDPEKSKASSPSRPATPIFIVGLPRSGTTVVERILANHPDVAQGGEFVCFNAALRERFHIENPAFFPEQLVTALSADTDWESVGDRYLQLTAFKHRNHAFFTDKLPFNFLLLPWIARALPQARFIHVRRNPMDTCFSNLKQLFSRHYAACYSQRDMAEYYLAYHQLMQTWDRLLPDRILPVRYESLVADSERETQRMLTFCGLSPQSELWRIERNAQPVATASAAQVRNPLNSRSVGAWKRYERQLQPLSAFLSEHPELAG